MNIELLHQTMANGGVVVMDGAMGTELGKLNNQSIVLGQESWSAAPLETDAGRRAIVAIHVASILAGAQILTTNTFRTHRLEASSESTLLACDLALEARQISGKEVLIAGSIGPVGDCYTPEDTPDEVTLWATHTAQSELLQKAGVDLILVETMPTAYEALIAAQAAAATRLPVIVSMYSNPAVGSRMLLSEKPLGPKKMIGGENLREVVQSLIQLGVPLTGFGVNCIHTGAALQAVSHLSLGKKVPISVYAQGDDETSPLQLKNIANHEQHYLDFVVRCLELGAQLVGGCCGVPPSWLRNIRRQVQGQTTRGAAQYDGATDLRSQIFS